MPEFEGKQYRDDRLKMFYVARCYLEPPDENDLAWITVFYEQPNSPPALGVEELWCVATYDNIERYEIVQLKFFRSRSIAEHFMRGHEVRTPLISLGGRALQPLPTYQEWSTLKSKYDWEDFDFRKMFEPGGENRREMVAIPESAVRIYVND